MGLAARGTSAPFYIRTCSENLFCEELPDRRRHRESNERTHCHDDDDIAVYSLDKLSLTVLVRKKIFEREAAALLRAEISADFCRVALETYHCHNYLEP